MGTKEETQIQINKQIVTLKQDQNISNSIMSKILAELENLAVLCGYKGKIQLNYYATKGQSKNEMINQIVYQMVIFYNSYKHFIKTNPLKKYEFPSNFSYDDVVNLVNDWKKYLSKSNSSYIKYYDSFLNILKSNKLDSYILEEFDNLDKDSKPTTKEDLQKALNAGAIATSIISDKNKEIEKSIIEKGDYKVNIVIGGKSEQNRFNKQYGKYEKSEEILKKEKKELSNIFNASIGYLELYYHLNKNCKDNSDNKFKYFNSIQNDANKYILKIYNQYKDEFIKKNINLQNDYKYEFFKESKVKQVEKDLDNWKLHLSNRHNKSLIDEINNAINVFCKNKEDSLK